MKYTNLYKERESKDRKQEQNHQAQQSEYMLVFQRLKNHFTYKTECLIITPSPPPPLCLLSTNLYSSEEGNDDDSENVTIQEDTARTLLLMD